MRVPRFAAPRRPVAGAAAVLAAALFASALIGSTPPDAAALPESRTEILGDFEVETAPWSPVQSGTGSVSTLTRTTAQHRSGGASAEWDAAVPTATGGALAAIGRDVVNLDAQAVRFSVLTESADRIVLRLRDVTGQTHQQTVAVTPSATQWTDVSITDFAGGTNNSHFGGANDGLWHGPLTRLSLVLTHSQLGDQPGTVYVDDVAVDIPPPEFLVEPTLLGNVFDEGQPVTVGFATAAESLSWQVYNHDGARVRSGSGAVADLGDAFTIGTLPVGWYEVDITVTRPDGTSFAAGTDIAVLPVADPVKDPRRGVGTHFGSSGPRQWSPEIIPLIARAGFGFARDGASWQQVETTKGQYTFPQKVLDYTAAFEANGLDFLSLLAYGNTLYFPNEVPTDQAGRDAYADYAAASVAQFGTEDTVYEVWNEWNWRKLDVEPFGTAESYVELLRTTHDRVKAEHPDAYLMGPAMTVAPTDWADWVDDFIAAGGLQYIDAFSIHPYSQVGGPELTDNLLTIVRDKLDAAGRADLPIVVSEQGWNTSTGTHHVSEDVQSANLVRGQLLALGEGVEQYAIYDFKDDGLDPVEPEHHFGIIGNDQDPRGAYRPKPAYVAQALMSRRINGKPVQGWSQLGDGVHDVRFTAGNAETVHAVWAAAEPAVVAFSTNGPVDVHGIYGSYQELVPDATGRVYVTVGADPVFVTGPITAADVSAAHALSVAEAFAGTETTGTWTIDRTGSDTGFEGSISVEGVTTQASVAAGERAEIAVELPPATRVGTRTWRATVRDADGVAAQLSTEAAARAAVEVSGVHAVTAAGGDDVLRLRARNNTDQPVTVGELRWTAGTGSGAALAGDELAAGESRAVDVPVDLVGQVEWSALLQAPTGDSTAEGTLRPTGELHAAPSAPVELDGEVDAVVGALTPAELAEPDIDDWGGAADLSGRLWWTHDADTLYLTAEVADDVASQTATGADIWRGDSVQVGIVAGAPGEEPRSHEVGVALTDAGKVEVWRWGPRDLGTDLAGVRGAAARDDAAGTTTYELAIPFASLPAARDDGIVSATVVVNDDDGAGRRGWSTWGEGVAESKNPAKYNALLLAGPEPTGLTADPGALELPIGIAGAVTVAESLSDGTTRPAAGVSWSSSDTGVATVAADGQVTGVAAGSAVVTATSETGDLAIPVTVTDATLRSVEVTPDRQRVPQGTELAFAAAGLFSDGSRHDLGGQVTWTSSSSRVAAVDAAGAVTALAPGATRIRAERGAVSGTTTLVVTPR